MSEYFYPPSGWEVVMEDQFLLSGFRLRRRVWSRRCGFAIAASSFASCMDVEAAHSQTLPGTWVSVPFDSIVVEVPADPQRQVRTNEEVEKETQTKPEVQSELKEPELLPPRKAGPAPTQRMDSKSSLSFLPPQKPIGQVSIDVQPKSKGVNKSVPQDSNRLAFGELPTVNAADAVEMASMWSIKPSSDSMNFPYQPLYFEELNLERYGRSYGKLQPAISGLRFFATIPSLPYAMTVHDPHQTYHWNRPYQAGWGAPRVRELRPLELKPSLIQAGAIAVLIIAVP